MNSGIVSLFAPNKRALKIIFLKPKFTDNEIARHSNKQYVFSYAFVRS